MGWVVLQGSALGRVFLEEGGAAQFRRGLEQLGGRVVYESELELNGGHGDLVVMGFEQSLVNAMAAVRRQYGEGVGPAYGGGGLALTEYRLKGGVTRLVGVQTGDSAVCLVIALTQSEADWRLGGAALSGVEVGGVALRGLMDVQFHAVDRGRGVSFTSGLARGERGDGGTAAAATVAAFEARGWKPAIPVDGQAGAGTMWFLLKGLDVCVVARVPGADGTEVIAVLHKPRASE